MWSEGLSQVLGLMSGEQLTQYSANASEASMWSILQPILRATASFRRMFCQILHCMNCRLELKFCGKRDVV